MKRSWLAVSVTLVMLAGRGARAQMIPPEVQQVIEKMQRGEKPSAEDLEKMKAWQTSMKKAVKSGKLPGMPTGAGPAGKGGAGGAGPFGGAGGAGGGGPFGTGELPSLEKLGMCPGAKTKLAGAVPSAKDYQKLVAGVVSRYGKKLGAKAVKGLDGELAGGGDPGARGLTLQIAALGQGSASGAVYVAARTAAKLPDDPVAASNLGALLSGVDDLSDAHQALLRADALLPKQALVLSNRAWTLYRAGDREGARALFQQALALNPDLRIARLGLGMLAACAGDMRVARPHLVAATSVMPSQPGNAANEKAAPQDPSPYQALTTLDLPPPIISSDINLTPRDAEAGAKIGKDLLGRHLAWQAEQMKWAQKANSLIQRKRFGGPEVARYQRVHEPYGLAMDKAYKKFSEEFQKVQQPWHQFSFGVESGERRRKEFARCAGPDSSRCQKEVTYKQCLEWKQQAGLMHPRMVGVFRAEWPPLEKTMLENWKRSMGLIETFLDAEWRTMHEVMLEGQILTLYRQMAESAQVWNGFMKVVVEMTCTPPPPPSEPQTFASPKVGDGSKLACPIPTINFSFKKLPGLALELECTQLKVELSAPGLGLRPMGYLAHDMMKGETTLFFGGKVGGDIGAANLEGRAGGYLSFTSSEWTGIGIETEGSVGAGGFGLEQSVKMDFGAWGSGPPANDGARQFWNPSKNATWQK